MAKRKGVMSTIGRPKAADIWDKTKGKCWYCGKQTNPYRDYSVDHVQELSNGGKFHINNLVPCCVKCNQIKADKGVDYLRSYMASVKCKAQFEFYFEKRGFVP